MGVLQGANLVGMSLLSLDAVQSPGLERKKKKSEKKKRRLLLYIHVTKERGMNLGLGTMGLVLKRFEQLQ